MEKKRPENNQIEKAADYLEESAAQKLYAELDAVETNWQYSIRTIAAGNCLVLIATLQIGTVSREGLAAISLDSPAQIRNAEREALQEAFKKFRCLKPADVSGLAETISDKPTQTATEKFTEQEQELIRLWRKEIEGGLTSIGVKPNVALNRFDGFSDLKEMKEARQKTFDYVIGQKRSQITQGYADSGWDLEEIERDMKAGGIENGIENASEKQVSDVFEKMKAAKMI